MKQNNHPKKTKSPITWVPTAYFAMGLPFVVLNMVTVLMFKGLGVEDKLITFWTSLILLPWTLKPLWSPFLELFKTKKFFVVATQLITGITFGLVAFSLNLPHFFSIAIALLAVIAFSGATHDIACDGVYMSELSNDDQAKYIGWQGAFYNIAKIIATGGLVYLAGYLKIWRSRRRRRCAIRSQPKGMDDYHDHLVCHYGCIGYLSLVYAAFRRSQEAGRTAYSWTGDERTIERTD